MNAQGRRDVMYSYSTLDKESPIRDISMDLSWIRTPMSGLQVPDVFSWAVNSVPQPVKGPDCLLLVPCTNGLA